MARTKHKLARIKFVNPQDTFVETTGSVDQICEDLHLHVNTEDFTVVSHLGEPDKIEKQDRYFIILADSIISEVDSQNLNIQLDQKFCGKTPMQAAKSAFMAMSDNKKYTCIFSIQECNDTGKLYSYRGVLDTDRSNDASKLPLIKAYKRDLSLSKSIKNTKKYASNNAVTKINLVISDGFVVKKKVIPPRAKDVIKLRTKS